MFLVPRRQIWTSQPQGPVAVDWSNTITKGLIFAAYGGGPDLVSGTQGVTLPSGKRSIAKEGYVVESTSTTDGGFYYPLSSAIPSVLNDCTVFQTVEIDSWSSYSALFGIPAAADTWTPPYGALGLQQTSTTNQIRLWGSGLGDGFIATTPLSMGSSYSVGVSRAGATAVFDINGATETVAGSVGTFDLSARQPICIFNRSTSNNGEGADGRSGALLIWDRALSARELESIRGNKFQIAKRPDSRIFVPVSAGGGTTTVTSDSTASYKLQGSVQASASAAYDIRTAIQADSAASYAIRSLVQQSIAPSYTVRAPIQQDTVPSYSIRGLADQAITASYAIRSAISSDVAATYNILSATSVSSSTSAGYNIRGSINQDTAASYALRGSITQDTAATYSILSASSVSSSATAGYAIKGSVESSIVAGYSIAQAVQAEVAASYIIRSGVVSEAQAAYIIRGLVQQTIAASYAIEGSAFTGSISDADIARIVQAVLSALNATTIPVNIKQVNSITIKGAGVTGNTWGPI